MKVPKRRRVVCHAAIAFLPIAVWACSGTEAHPIAACRDLASAVESASTRCNDMPLAAPKCSQAVAIGDEDLFRSKCIAFYRDAACENLAATPVECNELVIGDLFGIPAARAGSGGSPATGGSAGAGGSSGGTGGTAGSGGMGPPDGAVTDGAMPDGAVDAGTGGGPADASTAG